MSIIYVPRLIETTEQAEALPIGTVGHELPHLYAYIKKARNYWRGTGDDAALTDYEMLPFTALVPIEAEEEYSTERAGLAWDNDAIYSSPEDVRRDGWTDPLQRRYVTPWESA